MRGSPVTSCTSPAPWSLSRGVLVSLGLLSVVTAASAAIVATVPGLAPCVRTWLPRHDPRLAHNALQAASIAARNAALAGGVLIVVIGISRLGERTVGDVVVAAFALRQTTVVGAAIGAYGPDLLPYLPHLPIEWAGVAVPVGAWLRARALPLSTRQVAGLGVAIAALLTVAAVVETFCTPA